MEKRVRKVRVTETCLIMLTVLAVGFVLSRAERVAIPLTLAFILTLLLYPVVKAGAPRKIPPIVMVMVILVCFVAVFAPLGVFLNARLQSTLALLPEYHEKLVSLGRTFLQKYQMPSVFWDSINWYNTIGRYLGNMTGFLINWLGNLAMVMVFLIFMLLESPYMKNRLNAAFTGENGETVARVSDKIVSQISKYLRTLTVISFSTGVCVWFALWLIGVEFAIMWGVLAFVLNFIPTLGSIVASVPPILVAIVQYYPNPTPAALASLALLAIQFTIGNILTPKIMGDTLDLSPVVILISLMFWGIIWGVVGALLSVPITVMIKIICENVAGLDFVAVLMSAPRESHLDRAEEIRS
ncbi:MAG: AI-2E family transporter [Synergistaceae bacterium]|jgi:predicted PurR-regulated permease PerM|nr:AI-2E family transporter [Synergistaceae bacterium]